MRIPSFLQPGNSNPLPEDLEMSNLCEKYKECFGDYPTTEPSVYSTKQWIEFLQRCISENIRIEELLEGEIETPDLEEIEHIIIKE